MGGWKVPWNASQHRCILVHRLDDKIISPDVMEEWESGRGMIGGVSLLRTILLLFNIIIIRSRVISHTINLNRIMCCEDDVDAALSTITTTNFIFIFIESFSVLDTFCNALL